MYIDEMKLLDSNQNVILVSLLRLLVFDKLFNHNIVCYIDVLSIRQIVTDAETEITKIVQISI